MPITARYLPEKAPGETSSFGLDYSFVVPVGVGIESGTLKIFTNTATPAAADADFQVGPVSVRGRAIYATIGGGVSGKDYQFRWTAVDSAGNTWSRTALVLCADTS